jgi:hypothetical protein
MKKTELLALNTQLEQLHKLVKVGDFWLSFWRGCGCCCTVDIVLVCLNCATTSTDRYLSCAVLLKEEIGRRGNAPDPVTPSKQFSFAALRGHAGSSASERPTNFNSNSISLSVIGKSSMDSEASRSKQQIHVNFAF